MPQSRPALSRRYAIRVNVQGFTRVPLTNVSSNLNLEMADPHHQIESLLTEHFRFTPLVYLSSPYQATLVYLKTNPAPPTP